MFFLLLFFLKLNILISAPLYFPAKIIKINTVVSNTKFKKELVVLKHKNKIFKLYNYIYENKYGNFISEGNWVLIRARKKGNTLYPEYISANFRLPVLVAVITVTLIFTLISLKNYGLKLVFILFLNLSFLLLFIPLFLYNVHPHIFSYILLLLLIITSLFILNGIKIETIYIAVSIILTLIILSGIIDIFFTKTHITGFHQINSGKFFYLIRNYKNWKMNSLYLLMFISFLLTLTGVLMDAGITLFSGLKLKVNTNCFKEIWQTGIKIGFKVFTGMSTIILLLLSGQFLPIILTVSLLKISPLFMINFPFVFIFIAEFLFSLIALYLIIVITTFMFYLFKKESKNVFSILIFGFISLASIPLTGEFFNDSPYYKFLHHPLYEYANPNIKPGIAIVEGKLDNEFYTIKLLTGKYKNNRDLIAENIKLKGIDKLIIRKNSLYLAGIYENNHGELDYIVFLDYFRIPSLLILAGLVFIGGIFLFKKDFIYSLLLFILVLFLMIIVYPESIYLTHSSLIPGIIIFILITGAIISLIYRKRMFKRSFIIILISVLLFTLFFVIIKAGNPDTMCYEEIQLLDYFLTQYKITLDYRFLILFIFLISISGGLIDVYISLEAIRPLNSELMNQYKREAAGIVIIMSNTLFWGLMGENLSEFIARISYPFLKIYPLDEWYYFNSFLQTVNSSFVYYEITGIMITILSFIFIFLYFTGFLNKQLHPQDHL